MLSDLPRRMSDLSPVEVLSTNSMSMSPATEKYSRTNSLSFGALKSAHSPPLTTKKMFLLLNSSYFLSSIGSAHGAMSRFLSTTPRGTELLLAIIDFIEINWLLQALYPCINSNSMKRAGISETCGKTHKLLVREVLQLQQLDDVDPKPGCVL